MIKSLFNLSIMSLRLLRMPHAKNKIPLIMAFSKMHFRYQLSKILNKHITTQTFLGYEVSFFNYETFVYLFEEIFMQQLYFFSCDHNTPRIIDCGSNVGISIIYFKYLYPLAKIIAFEPDKKTFEKLQENITRNNIQDVQIHNLAIADFDGEIDFFYNDKLDGSLVMGVKSSRDAVTSRKVSCTSLSHYINEPVDLLKMDIEGAEGSCFADLDKRKSFGRISQIIMECHHNISEKPILSEVIHILEKNNFRYQVSAQLRAPFLKNVIQDVMIYAYKTIRV